MRCLYAVLQVDQSADDAAIRSAYRKGALQWHPDKNQNRLEEADTRFKELQNAYEILSDKHERAWYDDHREAILRSGDQHQAGAEGFSAGEKPDDFVDLYSFFSKSCFSGYNDGPQGFYTVYAGIFQKVAEQEAAAADAGSSSMHDAEAPPFGSSSMQWNQVAAFYNHWLAFVSCQEFTWADQYHPATAAVRKVRRMMEDENKKRRKAMRKEFNETVRELVAFVRKRDKRVIAHQAEEAKLRAEKEAEALKRREEERVARLEAAKLYVEADWIRESEAAADGYTSEDEAEQSDQYECVACDKIFKSEKALTNHTRSKKHKEKLQALREALSEDAALGTAAIDQSMNDHTDSNAEPKIRRGKKKKKQQQQPGVKIPDPIDASEGAASCSVCGHLFASRNQMFKHIAATGHAVRR
ncbi:hypothetical protein WJX84_009080 [Apatococcus fuscideae]|uniref:Uncharacterized protein n=1 Tax=Apatococcus fuscideae TaxID=2026836 RepID=A0AAW1TCH1_9CHLO